MTYKSQFKNYGLGLGLRKDLRQDILDYTKTNDLISWLEIVPENYIYLGGKKRSEFEEVLSSGITLIPHGVNLSIGTAPEIKGQPCFDEYLLKGLEELFTEIKPPWFSDHISCTRINGVYFQDLIPVLLNQSSLSIIADNIKYLQDRFQLPFLFENPSYYSTILPAEMHEVDFVNQLLDKANCGMLLDVNNVYVNSTNHANYSPEEYLSALNLDKVVQVHIAGHHEDYTAWLSGKKLKLLDTHGAEIKQEVYKILESLVSKTAIKAILLERDSNLPQFSELVDELKHIDEIINKSPVILSESEESHARIGDPSALPQDDIALPQDDSNIYQSQEEIYNYFTGKKSKLPEKTLEELSIYKSLILSNLEALLAKVLPLTYKILENNWRVIIQNFYENFPSQSPILNQAVKNFPGYLDSGLFKSQYEYPNYLSDLARYEWTSLESFNAPAKFKFKTLKLDYPISQVIEYLKVTEDDLNEIRETDIEEQDEFLLSFRDPKNFKAKFLALDETSYFVANALKRNEDLEKIYIDFKNNFANSIQNKNETELRKAFNNLVETLSFNKALLE